MNQIALCCLGLTKTFNGVQAVNNLDLAVIQGEILALVGPSGCGKTTLLRLVAGFEHPDAGQIILQDQVVTGNGRYLPPEQRGVGMVFQDYALFPHLSIRENVAFGLNYRPRREREKEVEALLDLVGLAGYGDRYPHELSGGERQRVALARALAPKPIVVLLDEPFSNLDADRRTQMREEVRAILKRFNTTSIFVTHDQEEALFMGDRLAVMNQGSLEQVENPEVVFHQPATRFVADFMGQTDFLPGQVTPQGILTEIGLVPQQLELPVGTKVELAVRTDDIDFEPQPGAQAVILERRFNGALLIYRIRLPSGQVLHASKPHTRFIPVGTFVCVFANPGHPLVWFPG